MKKAFCVILAIIILSGIAGVTVVNAVETAVIEPVEYNEDYDTVPDWCKSNWPYKIDPKTNETITITPYWKWETPEDVWTAKMYAVHEVADQLRLAGYDSDHQIMKALSQEWWKESQELKMLAKTVYYEAGEDCFTKQEDQQTVMNYVAATVLNRVNDSRFPNSVYEVLTQVNQYSSFYTYGFENIPIECYFAAATAMDGNAGLPSEVVYQANFPQGKEIYAAYYSNIGTMMYFCK